MSAGGEGNVWAVVCAWCGAELRRIAGGEAVKNHVYREAVKQFRRDFLARELAAHGGNRTKTAHALGLPRTYLLRLIRTLRIEVPRPPRRAT